jgi:hypothetical protein
MAIEGLASELRPRVVAADFWADLTLELPIQVIRILVLPWQALMEFIQAVPAEAALDLSDCFFFADEDPQSPAIERVTRIQLPEPEPTAEMVLSHALNAWNGLKCPSGGATGKTPVWGQPSCVRS